MKALVNRVQPYAWGSDSVIAHLQRRPVPAPGPEAELWMGAHPSAPSRLASTGASDPVALTDVIAADPTGVLGRGVTDRFGVRLPYLLKILAAAAPLSLQVHPDAEQARAGFTAEERAQPVLRNYVDPFHKPELLVALTDFDALCGFRDPEESAHTLAKLDVAALAPVLAALRDGPTEDRLRTAVQRLLTWPPGERPPVVAAVGERAREIGLALPESLARAYPDDMGVVLALLLNEVRLRAGEAIFMPAGNLHSYLQGTGVEVMAASDNVLRCGLTNKHVDVRETTRILRYEVLEHPVVPPRALAPGLVTWAAAVREFALVRATAMQTPVTIPGTGPRIVVCVRETARLRAGRDSATVPGGESVFVTAHEPEVVLEGAGAVVFQASVGDPAGA